MSRNAIARGIADITVRQNVQLHWVKIEDLPDLLTALENAGLTTLGACGDVTRNITGCPLAGVDGNEVFDASPVAIELNRLFVGNADFYNLPRKFKISITGCRQWCTYPEINDVGLTAVVAHVAVWRLKRASPSASAEGFLRNHILGVRLNAFVPYDKAIIAARTVAEIFRDADVLAAQPRTGTPQVSLPQAWMERRHHAAKSCIAGSASSSTRRSPRSRSAMASAITSESTRNGSRDTATSAHRCLRGRTNCRTTACRRRSRGSFARAGSAHHHDAEPDLRQRSQSQTCAISRPN